MIRLPLTLIPALAILWTAPALAQGNPHFAVDRFEPSERGSEWFASESLGFQGPTFFRAGAVSSFAERPFVLHDGRGHVVRSPVRDLEVIHVGGDVVLFDYLRFALDLPLQAFAAGKSVAPFTAGAHDQGVGDLRFGADVRVLGRDRGTLRLALGTQAWAPTGQRDQWASDGAFRIRPRVSAAGDVDIFTWSAQVGFAFRRDAVGDEIGASAAAGVRLLDQIVIGPEVFFASATDHSSTPVEAMLGAHWLIARTIRVGAALGHGFTKEPGAPQYRIIGSVEFAPELGPAVITIKPWTPPPPPQPAPVDADHDGVNDDEDACRGIAGIKTSDPATTGCPPDTDGDGVDDLNDACPTAPGPKTDDPATNGCPTTPPPSP